MKLNPILRRFLEEETGQTTVEYILILVVIVTIFMQLRGGLKALMKKLLGGLQTATDGVLDDMGGGSTD